MKLYYFPGACSLAPHITLKELGIPHELVKVDLRAHVTEAGEDYYKINFKGAVPLIELDNGARLSEGIAIVQYLADLDPAQKMTYAVGSLERYRVVEWYNFIADIHKCFGVLFHPAGEVEKAASIEKMVSNYTWVDAQLAGKEYLMGDKFTAADAYLFVTLRWAYAFKVNIDGLGNLKALFDRVAARPAVQDALRAEGLQA